jgi:hypothetical protein
MSEQNKIKAKLTMTIEWEYTIAPEAYEKIQPPVVTDQDRLNFDINAAKIDPWALLENGEWTVKEVTGRLLEDDSQ